MIILNNRSSFALCVDANFSNIVDRTTTNNIEILCRRSPLFGWTPHADRWTWVTAVQIRVMKDVVFDDIA
jgi:hypothetical protein